MIDCNLSCCAAGAILFISYCVRRWDGTLEFTIDWNIPVAYILFGRVMTNILLFSSASFKK